jgi:hypothetical protein
MGLIFPEGSAAPAKHWNARISEESYAPLAFARRLDSAGRIQDIINCYEYISFNFGHTLLSWLERSAPATYERILAGDAAGIERFGHGNAMAQACHHSILPLASDMDKEAEVAWGMADFESRFGRTPEGMWLPEAAVDVPTLEVLAKAGIAFTLLAPRQARAVARIDSEDFTEIGHGQIDYSKPYMVRLPSGREIAVFFYNGPLSQAVAFERLLEDGAAFWNRITQHAVDGLLTLGTDGETYGHHFTFGEMALAYVIDKARNDDNIWKLTNLAAYLADNPPTMQVRLHEPSSWSCVHGVERWRSNCGCADGGHPEYSQAWRGPLREAASLLKQRVDDYFFEQGVLYKNAREALVAYGRVRAGSISEEQFEILYLTHGLDDEQKELAWKLLAMQRWALMAQASCAWFFDDISRIEPVNAMTYGLRAMELLQEAGGPDISPDLLEVLEKAESNIPGQGTGADIWRREVAPRQETSHTLAAQGLLTLLIEDRIPPLDEDAEVRWPGVKLVFKTSPAVGSGVIAGEMTVIWANKSGTEVYDWQWRKAPTEDPFEHCFRADPKETMPIIDTGGYCVRGLDLPWNKRQDLALKWIARIDDMSWRLLKRHATRGAYMFQPWQESQHTQNFAPYWVRLAPALAWVFVFGLQSPPPGRADLVRFLRSTVGLMANTAALNEPLRERILELLEDEPAEASKVLARAREIGLELRLWELQNRYWQLHTPDSPDWNALGAELGFAVEEATPSPR